MARAGKRRSLPRRVARKAGKKGVDGAEDVVEEGCGCGCLGDGCLTLLVAGLIVPRLARLAVRRLR